MMMVQHFPVPVPPRAGADSRSDKQLLQADVAGERGAQAPDAFRRGVLGGVQGDIFQEGRAHGFDKTGAGLEVVAVNHELAKCWESRRTRANYE